MRAVILTSPLPHRNHKYLVNTIAIWAVKASKDRL